MGDRAREGGLFFEEADGVTANVLLKKLRGDGRMSEADPTSLSGFGESGEVALAIHPPADGWWAVVDSADGAAGIGAGEWSTPAIMANHIGTTAVWYRVYDDALALAMKLERGGSYFQTVAGTPDEVRAWLKELGCPVGAAGPAEAPKGATLAAIGYEPGDYESGPDRALAAALLAMRHGMETGDGAAVRDGYGALDPEKAALGLALLRGLRGDAAAKTFVTLARAILDEPMEPRGERPAVMTFAEEIVRRVAEDTDDDELFFSCIERLDAIESEAESRSSHAYTSGVEKVGSMMFRGRAARSFECYRRLVARDDEPAWHHVNLAIATLLMARPGTVALEGDAAEVVRRTEARLPDLGPGAKAAIQYNLACLYARAGDTEAALAHLERCPNPREQNPHPEQDSDLEPLWEDARFLALIDREDADDDDEELDDEDEGPPDEPWVPPPERAIPRLTLTFEEDDDGRALVSRMGGLPNAPSADTAWPSTESRPMDFVFQLTGKAAGGDIDMGDIHLLQAFADMEGEYYEDNELVLHRGPCPAVLEPPTGLDVAEVQTMRFEPDQDDRILIDIEWPDDDDPLHDDHQAAWSHAWTDKAWGVPVGGNLDPDVRDSQDRPMRCLLQLVSNDDWFLWYVFVNADFSEAVLEIIRG